MSFQKSTFNNKAGNVLCQKKASTQSHVMTILKQKCSLGSNKRYATITEVEQIARSSSKPSPRNPHIQTSQTFSRPLFRSKQSSKLRPISTGYLLEEESDDDDLDDLSESTSSFSSMHRTQRTARSTFVNAKSVFLRIMGVKYNHLS